MARTCSKCGRPLKEGVWKDGSKVDGLSCKSPVCKLYGVKQ